MNILQGKHRFIKKNCYGKFKYIIILEPQFKVEIPVIFPENLSHDSFKNCFKIVSAGFMTLDENEITCFGESTSLKKESRPDGDKNLMDFYFFRRK